MVNILSYFCIAVGLIFWVWGTLPLVGDRSILFKLHSLSVSDTLGSMSIIAGLLLKIPREWPLLILALVALAIWNTVLGYVIAYCASDSETMYGRSMPENLIPENLMPENPISDPPIPGQASADGPNFGGGDV